MTKEVEKSFAKQGFKETLDAEIVHIEKRIVKVRCKKHKSLTQQHDFFHAGVLTSLMDSACDYATLTTMPGYYLLNLKQT